jgi:protein TonB
MFEQSVLAADRKPGAFFASLTAQIAAVGVLIVVPLIYSEALPRVRLSVLPAFTLSSAPVPPDHSAVATTTSTRPSLLPRSIPRFVLPSVDRPAVEGSAPVIANSEPYVPGDRVPAPFQPGIAPMPQITVKPPAAATAPAAPQEPLQVGGDVQAAKIIRKVVPIYPTLAKAARVSGTVHLLGVVAKDGTIQKLQVLSGPPLLVQAAVDAVKQWVYRPTLLDRQPVEVVAPIDVIFTLSQ